MKESHVGILSQSSSVCVYVISMHKTYWTEGYLDSRRTVRDMQTSFNNNEQLNVLLSFIKNDGNKAK